MSGRWTARGDHGGQPRVRQQELQAERDREARLRRVYQVGTLVEYRPGQGRGNPLYAGRAAEVVRPPSLSAKHATVRVRFQDGHEETFGISQVKVLKVPEPKSPVEAAPPREQEAFVPEAPLLDARSGYDYRDLSGDERREINAIARAIHERRVIPDHAYRQRLVTPYQEALVEAAARDVGALANAGTPSQPRRQPLVGDHEEHGVQAFRDALRACKLWAQGRAPEAERYRDRALAHDAARRVAQRGLDEQARRHTGREFKGEVFSVRQDLGDGQFRQSYVRLVVVWGETGDELIVANARELQALAAFEVGADGWRDLTRWILDVSHPEGRATRVRRPDSPDQLIFKHRQDPALTPELRSHLKVRYPNLVRALHGLQLALTDGRAVRSVTLDDLPDGRLAPGVHEHPDRDDTLDG